MPALRSMRSFLLLVASAACAGSVEPIRPTFTIHDRSLWAGSAIVVESDAFVGLAGAPQVRVGEEWLPVERSGANAFSAQVPGDMAGTYDVSVLLDGNLESLPPVEVAGMTDSRQHEVFYQVDLQVFPGSGHATVFGGAEPLFGTSGPLEYPLTLTDLASGTTRQPGGFFYDFDGLRGPGASYEPGVYFGHLDGQGVHSFRLDASGVTPGPPVQSAYRMVMQTGPASWLLSAHHYVLIVNEQGTEQITAEETEGAVLSHAAGRATFRVDGVPSGLPVVRIPEGTLAYRLTSVTDPAAVAFSEDGQLLAVAGVEEHFPPKIVLQVFQAEDGRPVGNMTLPASPFAIAFDPVRPLLYVALNAYDAGDHVEPISLLVLDRETLATVGHVSTGRSALHCNGGCYKGVIAVSAEPAVYIAVSFFFPLRTFKFSLPDAP